MYKNVHVLESELAKFLYRVALTMSTYVCWIVLFCKCILSSPKIAFLMYLNYIHYFMLVYVVKHTIHS